jgi:hypothetical protein
LRLEVVVRHVAINSAEKNCAVTLPHQLPNVI